MKIKNIKAIAFIKNLEKAYTEGVYADTPANRKLGRVGMSYKEWTSKKQGQSGEDKDEIDVRKANRLIKTLDNLAEKDFQTKLKIFGENKKSYKGKLDGGGYPIGEVVSQKIGDNTYFAQRLMSGTRFWKSKEDKVFSNMGDFKYQVYEDLNLDIKKPKHRKRTHNPYRSYRKVPGVFNKEYIKQAQMQEKKEKNI